MAKEAKMDKHNISPRIDEFLTLMAQQTILQDNGEYGFSDEDERAVEEAFTEDEHIEGCDLFNLISVCDYYMAKVGRLDEYIQWQKQNHMNGY